MIFRIVKVKNRTKESEVEEVLNAIKIRNTLE